MATPAPNTATRTTQNETQPTPVTDLPNKTSPHLEEDFAPELLPNEINFPQLTPQRISEPVTPGKNKPAPQQEGTPPIQAKNTPAPTAETTPTFIWRKKDFTEDQPTTKGKEKVKGSESAPITRQGYRSGTLADDFWTTINIPNTPNDPRKRLRVYPFLINTHNEYLVDNQFQPHKAVSTVFISEQLVGIPWTSKRAQQHIVNAVTQELHKVLICNNQQTTPFHKWQQGRWSSQWTLSPAEE